MVHIFKLHVNKRIKKGLENGQISLAHNFTKEGKKMVRNGTDTYGIIPYSFVCTNGLVHSTNPNMYLPLVRMTTIELMQRLSAVHKGFFLHK